MRPFLVAVVSVLLSASLVARADDPAAKRHYEAGVKAYNLQRFDVALKEFQTAYEEREDAAFLFNIAPDYPVALVVTNTTIKGGPYYGASSVARCKLTADRIIIESNASGGIVLDTTDFAITNALIMNNGSTSSGFGGVFVSAAGESGKMSISNATITGNVASSTGSLGSGLGFLAAGTSVINTVIVGNTGGAREVDTTSGTFSSDAFVGASGTNENLPANCGPAQLFAAPLNADFHPKKGGVSPCTLIDVGQMVGAPDHDFDGVMRPQGAAFDVGAYEAK